MPYPIATNGPCAVIGITIAASVLTGVIGADVDALDAAAGGALPLVLADLERTVQKRPQKLTINAVSVPDTVLCKVDGLRTGLDFQAVAPCNLGSILARDSCVCGGKGSTERSAICRSVFR